MRDYLTLGPTPYDEPCAQLGTDHFYAKSRIESDAYIHQLLRQFGDPPGLCFFRTKPFHHEFGTYYEVVITFFDDDEEAAHFAYHVENNLPARWDEEALNELRATDYHMSVAYRKPSEDQGDLMALEPMPHYSTSCTHSPEQPLQHTLQMRYRSIMLVWPKGLPKSTTLRVQHTIQPDVRLSHRKWALYHRKVNHIDVQLASACAPLSEGAHAAHTAKTD